jgi:hypothetical protein
MKVVSMLFKIIWWIIKLPFLILKVLWMLVPGSVKSDIRSTRLK